MSRLRSRSFAILAVLFLTACGATAPASGGTPTAPAASPSTGVVYQAQDWKFAMSVSQESPWTKGAQRFADLVRERSGGKIKITVYPNGQISGGNQVAEFDLLRSGAVQFTYHSSIILSAVDPRFDVFQLPWLAPDFAKFEKVMDGPGQKIWQGLEAKGAIPLGGYSSTGYRQVTNNRGPIRSADDVKGLKFRVPGSKLYQSIWSKLGASPTTLAFGEVFGALQQHVIDGQENPLSLIRASKFYEAQKYLTVWNYSGDVAGILMSKITWDGLDAPTRALLQAAAKEAAQYHRQLQKASDQDDLTFLQQKMQVTVLDAAQTKAFQDVVEPVYAEFEAIVGKDLLQEIRQAVR